MIKTAGLFNVGILGLTKPPKNATKEEVKNFVPDLLVEINGRVFPDSALDNFQFGEFIRACLGYKTLSDEDSRGRKNKYPKEQVQEEIKPTVAATVAADLVFYIEEKEVVVDGKKQILPVKIYKRNT